MKKKILIVVGSTGGHYFPGVALGEKIREISSDVEVVFAGEKKIKNNEVWETKNFTLIPICVLKRPEKIYLMPLIFMRSIFVFIRSLSFILRVKPDLVVCMGSYSSVFIGISALVLRKPVIIHEQNFMPGLANRILNKFRIPAAITFEGTEKFLKKTIHTGLPLRKEMISSDCVPEDFGLSPDKKTVLILGGSQGAAFINDLVLSSLKRLNSTRFQFIHISGKKDYQKIKSFYEKNCIKALVKDFSLALPLFMNLSDIGIARAGAGTLAELSFKGIPSILIPYRFAGGHQSCNAKWAEKFGCIRMEESDSSPEKLINNLLILDEQLEERKKLFKSARIADINGNLARHCLKLLNKNGKLA